MPDKINIPKGIRLKIRPDTEIKNKVYVYSPREILDKTISVRTLLKFAGIVFLFLAILISVFLLGKASVNTESPASTERINENTIITSPESVVVNESELEKEKISEEKNLTETEEDTEIEEEEKSEEKVTAENMTEDKNETICENKAAEFDYPYKQVIINVSNFNKEKRGENWATITSLKLTITNNEECTIINPTQIKIKINNKGKGSIWWDYEGHLPETFERMKPGQTITEIVPVHSSYSDIYSEKELKIAVFDDYDMQMTVFKQYIMIK
jgi:hypothetical protein